MMCLKGIFLIFFRKNWDNDRIRLIVSSEPLTNKIDFPAITICNTFPVDRWGFLRDILNEAKFLCEGAEDCEDTMQLRRKLKPSNPINGPAFLNAHYLLNMAKIVDTRLLYTIGSDVDFRNPDPLLTTYYGKIVTF